MLSDRLRGVLKQYGPEVTFQVAQIALSDCTLLPEIELHDLLAIAAAESGVQVDAAMRALRGERSLDINASVREDLAVAEYRRRLTLVVEEHLSAGTWHGWFVGPGPEGQLNPAVLRQSSPVCALVPWIARVVHLWRKAHPSPLEKHISVLYRLGEDIIEIADWARATRPDIMPLTILQVRRRTRAWHKSKVVAAELALRPESPVVLENELYRVLRLETRAALEHEGRVMRHCVGDYWQAVVEGKRTRIYTVVEKATGKSLATVETIEKRPWNEVLAGGPHPYSVRQIKGFANARVTNVGVRATLATLYQQEGIQKERKSDGRGLDQAALMALGGLGGAACLGGIVADMVDRMVASRGGHPDHGPSPADLALRILTKGPEKSLGHRLYPVDALAPDAAARSRGRACATASSPRSTAGRSWPR